MINSGEKDVVSWPGTTAVAATTPSSETVKTVPIIAALRMDA
jgi:hypothetical protein